VVFLPEGVLLYKGTAEPTDLVCGNGTTITLPVTATAITED
jgi:hypothetical protein